MDNNLKKSYIDYYNNYNNLYKKLKKQSELDIFKFLLFNNSNDFSIYNPNYCLFLDKQQDDINVGIYSKIYLSNNQLYKDNGKSEYKVNIDKYPSCYDSFGFYTSKKDIKSITMLELIKIYRSFDKLKEMPLYIELEKYYKDYWIDYINLLLNNNIYLETDILPNYQFISDEFKRSIINKRAFVNAAGILVLSYKVNDKDGDCYLQNYSPEMILESINNNMLLLKDSENLINK